MRSGLIEDDACRNAKAANRRVKVDGSFEDMVGQYVEVARLFDDGDERRSGVAVEEVGLDLLALPHLFFLLRAVCFFLEMGIYARRSFK